MMKYRLLKDFNNWAFYLILMFISFGIQPLTKIIVPLIPTMVYISYREAGKAYPKYKLILIPLLIYVIINLIHIFTIGSISSSLNSFSVRSIVVLLPLFLICLDKSKIEIYIKILIFGLILSFIYNSVFALYNSFSIESGSFFFNAEVLKNNVGFYKSINFGGNYFFGKHFSLQTHPTYLSFIILFALLSYLVLKKNLYNGRTKVLLTIFLVLYLFLLSSRVGLATLIILSVIYTTKYLKNIHWIYKSLIVSLIILFFFSNSRSKEVLVKTKELVLGESIINPKDMWSDPRIMIWDSSLDLILKKEILLFGLGISESKQEELNAMYKEKGYLYPFKSAFNTHNQFLDIYLSLGVIGFLSFIGIFNMFYKGRHIGSNLIFFIILLFSFLFFENMFSRFIGSFSITLFYAIVLKIDNFGDE